MGRPKRTEPHKCNCGYSTFRSDHMNAHKNICKVKDEPSSELDEPSSELVLYLKQQYQKEIAAKDEQINQLIQQLAAKDEQIKAKDEQINQLIQNTNDHKAKRQKPEATTERKIKMSEPKRRIIAARQDWKCANPDGKCRLKDDCLEEYDVDHIIPLRIGGPDHPSNMQALCPACHRRKTERDARLSVPETSEQNLETFQECGLNTSCQPCVS